MWDYQCMLQSWASGNWRAAGFSPDPAAQPGHECQHVSCLTPGHPGNKQTIHIKFWWSSYVDSSCLWKMCIAAEFVLAILSNILSIRFLNLLFGCNPKVDPFPYLCPFLTSRSMGQWVSPGGCGWRTPSTITSTTRNTSFCKKNRQVFLYYILFHMYLQPPISQKHIVTTFFNTLPEFHCSEMLNG